MLCTRVGAGDLPVIPIGPIESYHNECENPNPVSHHDKGRPIETQFLFNQVIGRGGFSKVKKAVHKATGETYAIKVLDKSKMQSENFPRIILEIETLASVKHPSICKLYSAFYTTTKIYMVMEYCTTDLYEYLVKLRKPLQENDGRELFIQLLSAISYLHSVGIVHRDIKPENILLTEKMKLRLSDFGFAAKIPEKRNYFLSTYCGSLSYTAPEVITGVPYCGVKSDVWSLGVNLYVLLSSRLPFPSTNAKEQRLQIINGRYPVPRHFKKKSINLIKRLLQVNPLDRATLDEVWKDAWLRDESVPQDFFRLYYSYHRHKSLEGPGVICPSGGKRSSLFWGGRPSCRTEPVQMEKFSKRRALCQFCRLAKNRIVRCVNFIFCCKV